MINVITRLGPSPTNSMLHIGNLRTLLFNYLFAKKNGGKFFVRLEDTDRERYAPEFLSHFEETLNWLGIDVDASYWKPDASIGSFVQSERDYSTYVKYLIDNGFAYYAFDTKEDLEILRAAGLKYDRNTRLTMCNSFTLSKEDTERKISENSYVVRFAINESIDINFNDIVYGSITINTNTLDDKVLLKSNGIGSYHLCNVCDDHNMGITHVMRGEEWINSTPFHIILYKAFGWDVPKFAHLPNVLTPDGKKLSKRTSREYGIPISPIGYVDKVTKKFINGFREEGYEPEALLNYLVLLGWASDDNTEVMSMSEMINKFSLDRVHTSGAKMDMDKLKWFNHTYIKDILPNNYLLTHVKFDNAYSDDELISIINMSKDRSDFVSQMQAVVDLFDKDVILSDEQLSKIPEEVKFLFQRIHNSYNINVDNWNIDNIKSLINDLAIDMNLKVSKIMPSLRIALTGGLPGPDLYNTMMILGYHRTLQRLYNVSKSMNVI